MLQYSDSMSRARRVVLFSVLGLGGLVVAALVALHLLADPAAHRARVEQLASRALGLDVSVGGRMTMHWLRGARLVLQDVHVRKRDAVIVSAPEVTLHLDAFSLLGQTPRLHKIVLRDPVIMIERDRDGRFNVQTDVAADAALPAHVGPELALSGATIRYTDARFGAGFEGRDCRLELRDLQHAGGRSHNAISGVSFSAEFGCGEVHKDGVTVSELKGSANAQRGIVELKPISTHLFGTSATGSVRADLSGPEPTYQISHTVPKVPVEDLLKMLSLKPVAAGRIDVSATLSMQGKTTKELQRSLTGKVSLRGEGLTYNGADLDAQFARVESSQTFSLFDVGAVLLAGPLGLVVTKGYDFATVAQAPQGSSEIHALVSDWRIERGIARTNDVALATKANRVALRGSIDLVNDRFDDMTIALVDAKGCVKLRQQIRGTLAQPSVDRPSLVRSLTGPAARLLKKGTDLLMGDACDVFYAGAVAAPK
jgi:AsmA protein